MPSNAISGIGVRFYRWGTSWVEIGEISSISGPSKSREFIDVTTLGSVGGYKEFIASFRDGGTVQLNMNFTRDTYDLMNADYESNDKQNYEIVIPDDSSTSFEFVGLVTELSLEITPDDKITANVSIKVSGKVTVNDGSGSN